MPAELWLILACGAVVGLSLGLTGGGGSIFAVPLLIYVLGSGVREAVGISLATVGATALFGAALRNRSGLVEWRTGFLFAATGMLGAPAGTWLGARMPDALTLAGFAVLMLVVGVRMWRSGGNSPARNHQPCARSEHGELRLTGKCFAVLLPTGLLVGVLTGIFGVGGGFIIVPALVFVTGMAIHRAVATSLLVIAMICAAGVGSYFFVGSGIPVTLTLWFLAGGLAGMTLGHRLSAGLGGPALNRVFAASMWAVALFVLSKTALSFDTHRPEALQPGAEKDGSSVPEAFLADRAWKERAPGLRFL